MKIDFIKGDLLESDCDIIVHQVNCQKKMGSGIALQIRKKYPKTYEEYMKEEPLLGKLLLVEEDDKYVANFYSQYYYKNSKDNNTYTFTNYEAFEVCCEKLKREIQNMKRSIIVGFPYKIGCGLGGGDWEKVLDIITRTFENTVIPIRIYEL